MRLTTSVVVSACRRVHVRDIIKRSKWWSDRGERERGLSRERDVPAALKIMMSKTPRTRGFGRPRTAV